MNLVLGATGTIGRHLVPLLVARGERVRIVSRDEARAKSLLGPNVELVVGSLQERAVADAAFSRVRRAFLTINSDGDQEATERAAFEAARRANVEHLVKVSVIAPSADHVVHLARVHHRLEAVLAGMGVAHTILRPNWFMENFFGSATTIAQGAIYGAAGDGRVAFVGARDIAAVADCVLQSPGRHGRDLVITGPSALTFADAASEIGQGLGRPVAYTDLDEASFSGALSSAGLPPSVVDVVLQINRNARSGGLVGTTDTVLKVVGRHPLSLAAFARDNAGHLS